MASASTPIPSVAAVESPHQSSNPTQAMSAIAPPSTSNWIDGQPTTVDPAARHGEIAPALLAGTTFDPTNAGGMSSVYDPSFTAVSAVQSGADPAAADPTGVSHWLPNGEPNDVAVGDSTDQNPNSSPSLAEQHFHYHAVGPLFGDLLADQRNFYSPHNLYWVAAGIGGAAIFANTNVDQWFRQTYFEHLRPVDSNLDFVKDFGTGGLVIPAMAGLWFVDQCIAWTTGDEDMPAVEWIDQWSNRSLRGWIVGAVPLVTLQYVTGASRPGQTSAGSHWTPFKSTHGVSGHAFVGSVPFFTAAEMTDFIPLKIGFYAMGSAAGISRIYTDSHYLSQVGLGWWLAYFSTVAVSDTVFAEHAWQLVPLPSNDATGVAIMYQY
ncbi:MAG TPA: phosphatase PAP2 family protein [Pirellulales bacterium]